MQDCINPKFPAFGDMHFHGEFKGVSTNTAIFIGQYNPMQLILLVFLPVLVLLHF